MSADNMSFRWESNYDGVTITDYTGKETDVVIPETIDGRPVTAIGNGAFACTDITSVTIPACVKIIGEYSFGGCDSLANVNIPEGLTSIDNAAFMDCDSLKSIVMPKSVTRCCNIDYIPNVHYPGFEYEWYEMLGETLPEFYGGDRRHANIHFNYDPAFMPEFQEGCYYPSIWGSGSFRGVKIAAYGWDFVFGENALAPAQGDIVTMTGPSFWQPGDCFACSLKDGFVYVRILRVLSSTEDDGAAFQAEVLLTGDMLSFVKRVSQSELEYLKREAYYNYIIPSGGMSRVIAYPLTDSVISLTNSYGGGDITSCDYIYTDEDGVDHLVQARTNYTMGIWYHYYGDKVLGLRENRPVVYEDGICCFIDKS